MPTNISYLRRNVESKLVGKVLRKLEREKYRLVSLRENATDSTKVLAKTQLTVHCKPDEQHFKIFAGKGCGLECKCKPYYPSDDA